MLTRIIKIGNSQGLRIPKPILKQTGISDKVEMDIKEGMIIIKPVLNPRHGWDKAFKKMAQKKDDELIWGDENIEHSWDKEEWEW